MQRRAARTRVGLGLGSKVPGTLLLTSDEIRTRNVRDNIAKHEAELADASVAVGIGTSSAGRVMQLRRRVFQAKQELAHLQSGPYAAGSDPRVMSVAKIDTSSGPAGTAQHVFVVKVRNLESRSWGDQVEVKANSAKDAAESVSGESLIVGPGDRARLRARVWPTPFGSQPDIPFYASSSAS